MSSLCVSYDVKFLFQVVSKCANNYRFMKGMFPLQTLTDSLDETILGKLDYSK